MEMEIEMNLFDVTAYPALALHVAGFALTELLGAPAQYGDLHVSVDIHPDGTRTVHLVSRVIHVPGTHHLYKGMVSVGMRVTPEGDWSADSADVHLAHPKTGDWDEENGCTFVGDLAPGLDYVTMFSTDQFDVENPRHSATHLLPVFTSKFPTSE